MEFYRLPKVTGVSWVTFVLFLNSWVETCQIIWCQILPESLKCVHIQMEVYKEKYVRKNEQQKSFEASNAKEW